MIEYDSVYKIFIYLLLIYQYLNIINSSSKIIIINFISATDQ